MMRPDFMPSPGEIHVWTLDLRGVCESNPGGVLSGPEIDRARRFAFERDRNRFVRARCGLRQVLAAYLGSEPGMLPIVADPHGKPRLVPDRGLSFSLSHSHDRGVVAVARGCEVGVDTEVAPARGDLRCVTRSVFAAPERCALDRVPDCDFAVAFLILWTRKEALLKAVGLGFAMDPASVTVGIEPGRRRVRVPGAAGGQFADVETLPRDGNCVTSVAVVGRMSHVRSFSLSGSLRPALAA